jgi:hypothetical protein
MKWEGTEADVDIRSAGPFRVTEIFVMREEPAELGCQVQKYEIAQAKRKISCSPDPATLLRERCRLIVC